MAQGPPGNKVIGTKSILTALLLASAWAIQPQSQNTPSSPLHPRVESPHENNDPHIPTSFPHRIETPPIERKKSTSKDFAQVITKPRVRDDINQHDVSAIEPLAPADRAVRAPFTRRSSVPESGLASPQIARDLSDWEVEEIILLATVDGTLHCRHRKTGHEIWTLDAGTAMVESTHYKRNRSTLEDEYQPIDHYLWAIEPKGDGNIFVYIPTGSQGVVNTGLTMKRLVEDLSPYADSTTQVLYTGEKKTTMVTVDARTGQILKWFGSGDTFIDEEVSCNIRNGILEPDNAKCSTRGTLTFGRTEYRVDIHSKDDGGHIATLKYLEWQPNNFDKDLDRQYQTSKDGRYVYARHDGSIIAVDIAPNRDPKALFKEHFSSPVARVYDVIRPWRADEQIPELVILEQPVPPADEESLIASRSSIFLGHTTDGSWYAMSGATYPTVVSSSKSAMCNARDWWHPGRVWENMKEDDLKKAMVGRHSIDSKPPRSHPLLTIEGSKAAELIDSDANASVVLPVEPEPSTIVQSIRELPAGAKRHFTDFISNPMLWILVFGVLFFKWKDIGRYVGKIAGLRQSELEKPMLPPRRSSSDSAIALDEIKAPSEGNGESIVEPSVEAERSEPAQLSLDGATDVSPEVLIETPTITRETSLNDSNNDDNANEQTNENLVSVEQPLKDTTADPAYVSVAPVEKVKKAHRGKRGGHKNKKAKKLENKLNSEDATEMAVNKLPVTVDEAVRDAQKLGDQNQSHVEPDVRTIASDVNGVSGPVIKLGSMEVNMNKVIGTGSNGTMVFEGKYDGREVAVKRMLMQFYDLASQETKLLRESDDHKNVVRYYAQQESAGFLYIALELCPASLSDVIDRPDKHRLLAQEGEKDTPSILRQITQGLHHLHDLRIVHRDLKPQNILVKIDKNGKPQLLVSDFGLCKKLEGEQSSFRATTAHAAGTMGWRAPELLLDDDIRDGSRIAFEASDPHMASSSPHGDTEMLPSRRATRAIDIFSLGLIFFYVLTKGQHPFDRGDRYMREVNIRKNDFSLDPLSVLGDYAYEAKDLIAAMLDPSPKRRPTAYDVLAHPFFWDAKTRLAFLCDVSDHFEKEQRDPPSEALRTLESYAPQVIRDGDFLKCLGREFVDSLGKQRKYTGGKMLDLLRALRNKRNHYEDMTPSLRASVGSMPEGYLSYWTTRFPNLLTVCWQCVWDVEWQDAERFQGYYRVSIA